MTYEQIFLLLLLLGVFILFVWGRWRFDLVAFLALLIAAAAGAVPLILASGAGAESRTALGIVIFSGIITATALTLYIVPVFYALLAPYTRSPGYIAAAIKRLRRERPETTPAE